MEKKLYAILKTIKIVIFSYLECIISFMISKIKNEFCKVLQIKPLQYILKSLWFCQRELNPALDLREDGVIESRNLRANGQVTVTKFLMCERQSQVPEWIFHLRPLSSYSLGSLHGPTSQSYRSAYIEIHWETKSCGTDIRNPWLVCRNQSTWMQLFYSYVIICAFCFMTYFLEQREGMVESYALNVILVD